MDFIKRNLFMLICAIVGLASIGGVVWGITRMSEVTAQMQQIASIENNLAGLTRSPVGVGHVTNEYDRINAVAENHDRVLTHFTERSAHQPIMEDMLPDPPGTEEESRDLRYEFRPAYRAAMQALVTMLHAGEAPTKEEIAHVADYIKKKKIEAELTASVEVGDAPSGGTDRSGAGRTPGSASGSSKDKVDLPERDGPASCEPYWRALAARAKDNADMIAAIQKAREIYCYVSLKIGGAFDLHPVYVSSAEHAPDMDEVWFAHMLYWPQLDVIKVLAAVNDAAAAELQGAGQPPWVGNVPVKDVLSIRVSNYIMEDSASSDAGQQGELPPTSPDAMFTQQFGHDLYDVINVRTQLIIDVRDLPQLLDQFQHDSYVTVANVSYEHVGSASDFTGKIYGPEPLVKLTLDLQLYYSYRAMVPLMPEVVREQLGTQAQFEELVGGDEDTADGQG